MPLTLVSLLLACGGAKLTLSDDTSTLDDDTAPTDDTAPCDRIGALTVDETPVEAFWWGNTPPPSWSRTLQVTVEPCRGFVVESSAPWLDATLRAEDGVLSLSPRPGEVVSGRHEARVTVRDEDGDIALATVEVRLAALVQPAAPEARAVLVIGVDGLDGDELPAALTPSLERVRDGGVWTWAATTQRTGPTLSGPGWTSVLSGVEVDRHGVTGNGGYDGRDTDHPSFLWQARHRLGLPTTAAIHWTDIFEILEVDALDARSHGSDDEVAAAMVEALRSGDWLVHFAHLDDVDHAGHGFGFTADAPQYVEAIEASDARVGAMFDAILDRPGVAFEDWLVVITSDHGGTSGGSHGCTDADCQIIPFIVAGPSVTPAALADGDASHLDVAPSVLDFLGLDVSVMGLDGVVQHRPRERDCADDLDEDGDGDVDCQDADCVGDPLCWVCAPDDLGDAVGTLVTSATPLDDHFSGSCGGAGGAELLYTWTAPADGLYSFDTMAQSRDTVLYLLDGGCEGGELACNERPSSTQRSVVSASLTAGQTVTVVVDSDASATGPTSLAIWPASQTCPDQDLGNSVGTTTSTFTHQDVSHAGSCPPAVGVRWFSWRAPRNGTYTIRTTGSDFDTVLYVLDGCGGAELACNDDSSGLQSSVSVSLSNRQDVVIGVGSFAGRATTGNLTLEIRGP